jgi:hypothetical protein
MSVFISYARQDRPYVEQLADHLAAAGVPVWFDHELTAGQRWLEMIRSEIDRCAAFVVVMTPESEESDWVNREINRAEEKGKPVFPLLLRGGLFFRLSNLQAENVTGGNLPPPSFIARLVAQIGPAAVAPIRTAVRVRHPESRDEVPTTQQIVRLVENLHDAPDEDFFVLDEAEEPSRFFQALFVGDAWQVEYRDGAAAPVLGADAGDRAAVVDAALGWARGDSRWPQALSPWREV